MGERPSWHLEIGQGQLLGAPIQEKVMDTFVLAQVKEREQPKL